jgi:hypothetical protein
MTLVPVRVLICTNLIESAQGRALALLSHLLGKCLVTVVAYSRTWSCPVSNELSSSIEINDRSGPGALL